MSGEPAINGTAASVEWDDRAVEDGEVKMPLMAAMADEMACLNMIV